MIEKGGEVKRPTVDSTMCGCEMLTRQAEMGNGFV